VIREHHDAVTALLNADTAIIGRLHDAALINADGSLVRDTYWVLFGGAPDELDDDRLTSQQTAASDATFVYTVRSVSSTAAGARAAASRAFVALVGRRPVIAGRICQAIRLDGAGSVEPDRSVTPSLFYEDDDYLLRSTRA